MFEMYSDCCLFQRNYVLQFAHPSTAMLRGTDIFKKEELVGGNEIMRKNTSKGLTHMSKGWVRTHRTKQLLQSKITSKMLFMCSSWDVVCCVLMHQKVPPDTLSSVMTIQTDFQVLLQAVCTSLKLDWITSLWFHVRAMKSYSCVCVCYSFILNASHWPPLINECLLYFQVTLKILASQWNLNLWNY